MKDQEPKEVILQFINSHFKRTNEVPSLRGIVRKFRKKLNFTAFYRLFPKGLAEACELAGVPVPKGRIKHMKKLKKVLKKEKMKSMRLVLCPIKLY